jgi:membrane protein DedA with SNARE-associated domain
VLGTVALLLALLLANREALDDPQRLISILGYPAVFLLALLGSGTLFIPLPAAAGVFVGGMLLNPVIVGLVAGLGEGLGEMVGYGIGRSGQGLFRKRPISPRWEETVRKRGGLAVFAFSLVPNPFFDFIGLAAGALGFPAHQFFLATWAGKTIKSVGIALAGHLGAEWVSRLLRLT